MSRLCFAAAACAALAVLVLAGSAASAAEPAPKAESEAAGKVEKKAAAAAPAEATPAELIEKLAETLSGCKMLGSYTVSGKTGLTPKPEEYTITSAMKLEEPDLWMIKARIKYGKNDTTIPIPLEIKWAGDTPVITLTNLTIPGMGTFSSRVVIYEGRYAGTWQHGKVGGHLYGRIEKVPAESTESK
jgi:hypothetical protein